MPQFLAELRIKFVQSADGSINAVTEGDGLDAIPAAITQHALLQLALNCNAVQIAALQNVTPNRIVQAPGGLRIERTQ